MEVRTRYETVITGAEWRRNVCWIEHGVDFGLHAVIMVLQSFYSVFSVLDSKSCERHNMFLQRALLKSIFDHEILIDAMHHVLAVICLLESTLERADVEVF